MDGTDIKKIVREKYGQAALRGKSGSCCGTATQVGRVAIRSLPICTTLRKCNRFLGQRCRLRSGVETRPPWPN